MYKSRSVYSVYGNTIGRIAIYSNNNNAFDYNKNYYYYNAFVNNNNKYKYKYNNFYSSNNVDNNTLDNKAENYNSRNANYIILL